MATIEVTLSAREARLLDARELHYILEDAHRVFWGTYSQDLTRHIHSGLNCVVENGGRIAGFILGEMRPFSILSIVAAAVRDRVIVDPCFDACLSLLEERGRHSGATSIVQVGYAPWLTDSLSRNGFYEREKVVTYGWNCRPVDVQGNTSVQVCEANLQDLQQLQTLDRDIFGPIWHKPVSELEYILRQSFLFTIARNKRAIVGYQWSEKSGDHGHLTRLAVHPDWQGKGIGTRLLTGALAALTGAGTTWVTLNTQQNNLRSRCLYEGHGFRVINRQVSVLWKDIT